MARRTNSAAVQRQPVQDTPSFLEDKDDDFDEAELPAVEQVERQTRDARTRSGGARALACAGPAAQVPIAIAESDEEEEEEEESETREISSLERNMMNDRFANEVCFVLSKHFHLEEFRRHQQAAIHATPRGEDVFCLMPTSGGKSLCYQVRIRFRRLYQSFNLVNER